MGSRPGIALIVCHCAATGAGGQTGEYTGPACSFRGRQPGAGGHLRGTTEGSSARPAADWAGTLMVKSAQCNLCVTVLQQELEAKLASTQEQSGAAEAECQILADTYEARLRRLERDLLLTRRERRVREALEYAIAVIRGSEDAANEGLPPPLEHYQKKIPDVEVLHK